MSGMVTVSRQWRARYLYWRDSCDCHYPIQTYTFVAALKQLGYIFWLTHICSTLFILVIAVRHSFYYVLIKDSGAT